MLYYFQIEFIVETVYGKPKFLVGVHFHPTEQYCQEPSINVSFYFSHSLNVRWQQQQQKISLKQMPMNQFPGFRHRNFADSRE